MSVVAFYGRFLRSTVTPFLRLIFGSCGKNKGNIEVFQVVEFSELFRF